MGWSLFRKTAKWPGWTLGCDFLPFISMLTNINTCGFQKCVLLVFVALYKSYMEFTSSGVTCMIQTWIIYRQKRSCPLCPLPEASHPLPCPKWLLPTVWGAPSQPPSLHLHPQVQESLTCHCLRETLPVCSVWRTYWTCSLSYVSCLVILILLSQLSGCGYYHVYVLSVYLFTLSYPPDCKLHEEGTMSCSSVYPQCPN